MQNQKLTSFRSTDYKCPECGTITTIQSLSMTPTASVSCIDCGTRVFCESDSDVGLTIKSLEGKINDLLAEIKQIDHHMVAFKPGTKGYRDLLTQEREILRQRVVIINYRLDILGKLIKGS